MLRLIEPFALHTFLCGTVAAALITLIAMPTNSVAADLKKLADELVNQSEQPAAITGDLDGDGHADPTARGIDKADIRRGMKVDAGNALNARDAGEGKNLEATPAKIRAGDPISDIDITVDQGLR